MNYSAGACNIGRKEIRRRYALGAIGFIMAALFAYSLYLLHAPAWTYLFSIVPFVIGFEGFYQGYLHFCAGFAAMGVYDLTGSGGKAGKVTNGKDHKKDLSEAAKINGYSIASAAVAAFIVFCMALLFF